MKRSKKGMVMNSQHLRETKVGCPLLKVRSKETRQPYDDLSTSSTMTQMAHEFIELVRGFYALPDEAHRAPPVGKCPFADSYEVS